MVGPDTVCEGRYGAGTRAPAAAATAQPTPAQRLIGDFAPKLVELTDNVLFGDVWARPQLSPRDRSLATVSALIAMNRPAVRSSCGPTSCERETTA